MMNCYFSAYPSSILLEALGTFGSGARTHELCQYKIQGIGHSIRAKRALSPSLANKCLTFHP